MEHFKANRRGRPSISPNGATAVTTVLPNELFAALCKETSDEMSLSAVARTRIVASQNIGSLIKELHKCATEARRELETLKKAIGQQAPMAYADSQMSEEAFSMQVAAWLREALLD